ncbi:MAG: hypothetical protein HYY17_04520 [Planctomycetes bacterium]|nr:hypothetical protein [Planctomycetota bacterium]
MSEEKAPNKFQAVLYQHGEKFAVGGAGLLLVGYVVFALVLGGDDKTARQVQSSASTIEQESVKAHPALAAPEFPERAVTDKDGNAVKGKDGKPLREMSEMHDMEALKYWQKLPAAGVTPPGGDWVTSLRTVLKGNPLLVKKPPDTRVIIGTVKFEKAEPGFKGVTLTWTVSDAKGSDKEKAAKIDEVVIERTNKTTGKKDKSYTVAADKSPFTDEAVEKRVTYEYRLVPQTKDPDYLKARGTGQGPATASLSVTMLDEWILTFSQFNPQPNGKGSVYIKIEKIDAQYGHVEKSRIQSEGDEIGKWEDDVEYQEDDPLEYGKKITKTKKEPTFKHKVQTPKGLQTVEFNTRCKLVTVREIKATVKYMKCNPKFGDCKQTEQVENVTLSEVVYTDADSKTVSRKHKGSEEILMKGETEIDPSDWPAAKTGLCPQHGGKKPEIKDDPDKDKKEKLESDARTTLAEADAFKKKYEDKLKEYNKLKDDPKKTEEAKKAKTESDSSKASAIEKYRKFLADYKDTKAFKEHQKRADDALKKLGG